MESLSELLKNMPGLSLQERTDDAIRTLMNEPLIRKLRTKHPEITDYHMKINLNRLYQCVREYKNCSACPGLERCPNDMEGHYTVVKVESHDEAVYLHDHKVACKKWYAQQAQAALKKRIQSFYIDEAILEQGYNLADMLKCDKSRIKAVDFVDSYVRDTAKNGLNPRGMYLCGELGTGKTYLMGYMLHELAKHGFTGVIVYMPDFVEDLKAMFQEPGKLKESIELLKQADLLVFDDIGAENLNPWLRDHVLGTILNHRMNRKPTFFTSNYDLDGLEKHLSFTNKDGEDELKGKRLMDRIRHFVDVVDVKGNNKRGKVK